MSNIQWFPMRVTYGREEAVKKELDQDGVENFLPMREDWVFDDKRVPHRRLMPAIRNLIFVHSSQDDRVQFLEYNHEFLAKPGKRVRVTDGDVKGSEGIIRRIKKNQCVVVQVEGVAAVAITFVPSAWLEEI